MAETKESVEIRTIKIEGKTYDVESITADGEQLITNIKKIDEILSQKQIELDIVNLAKDKLIDELVKESSNFREVPADQTKESS